MSDTYWMVLKERIPTVVEPLTSLGQITTEWRAALRAQNSRLLSWVGEQPRVTRLGGLTEQYSIRVAWPLKLTGNVANPEAHVRNMVAEMNNHINAWDFDPGLPVIGTPTPNWSPAVVTRYLPAINGPLSWWETGLATRSSLTMNRASTASAERAENPIGPDDATTRIGGAPGSREDDKYGRWLTTIAWGAGVVAVSLVVAKGLTLATVLSQGGRSTNILVGPTSPTRQLPGPRSNPSRRRRANRHPR
jgi:hypothetical protein